jgi:S-DNA-T family DNA segregation ATPase FtsK/SpoIIIE
MGKGKQYNNSRFKRFLLFAGISLLLIASIAGLLYWQWQNISDTSVRVAQVFGWGLVLVVLWALTLAVIILSKPILIWRYWNKSIGSVMLLFAIWGMLSLVPGSGYLNSYSLGGQIGQSVTGPSTAVGILVILALLVFGTFFVIPKGFAHAAYNAVCWIAGRFRKEFPSQMPVPAPSAGPRGNLRSPNAEPLTGPYPRYKSEPRATTVLPVSTSSQRSGSWLWNKLNPRHTDAPLDVSETGVNRAATEIPAAAMPGASEFQAEQPAETEAKKENTTQKADSDKDLKQAAQDVWKKYGESDALITADGWKLPPLEILDNTPDVEFSQADNLKKAKLIEDALASYGVEGKVVQINVGPTVTQFGIEPGWDRKLKEIKEKDKNGDVRVKIEEIAKTRVKVDRITSLSNDLSLALAAPSIRIEAPVPGKSVVGIEVPNTTIGTVSLRSVVESNVFQKLQLKAKLAMALGKGAGGESVVGDLTKMPHLLIAGATGSGKTVCMHSIICCLLLYNTPGDLRFIMIDPKRVELTSYNSLPHLATPVIVDTNKALGALRWLSQEMDKRYQIMAAARCRNIEAYNKSRPNEKMSYLVLIVDELADLMMTAGDEVERTLCRLAQLARATGIHLIVATQRPSVDVVTGLIKANFPSRISFAVTSQVDSRTILDSGGAEKLLGRGDMLYMPTEAAKPKRLQGCFVSDPETERLVYFWNNQKKETAAQLKMDDIIDAEVVKAEKMPEDPLMEEARKLLEEHEHISVSFLQRHLRIGYPRAARLMEQLEQEMGGSLESDSEAQEEEDR